MPNRDDFSDATKKIIAQRAGYRCSYLGCGMLTIGPSDESTTATSSIGMACHISAASSGKTAKRYDPKLSSEQRAHADNGIWACYTHGKLIDTDQTRFTTEILKLWKGIAEHIAMTMIDVNCEYSDALRLFAFYNLAHRNLLIPGLGNENELIGNSLKDCGVGISWGELSEAIVRDYLIEVTRNTFIHSEATKVELVIEQDRVILRDDGKEFNTNELLKKHDSTGGILSAKSVSSDDLNLVTLYERQGDYNVNTIMKIQDERSIINLTPCHVRLDSKSFKEGNLDFTILEKCNHVFVILPKYMSPSDFRYILQLKQNLQTLDKSITLIYKDVSHHLLSIIKSDNPEWSLIRL